MNWNEELTKRLGYTLPLPENGVVDPKKKHDFIFVFDATGCNPNGDPDNDNMPRQDFETSKGLVSDVCLKRKIRDFVGRAYETEQKNDGQGYDLFVKHRGLLTKELTETAATRKEGAKDDLDENQKLVRRRYWDVRMFGAVLTVGKKSVDAGEPMEGQVSEAASGETKAPQVDKNKKVVKSTILNGGQCVGPMQLGFAVSYEEIDPRLLSIVRDARVDNKEKSPNSDTADSAMPGSKPYLPYGLYVCRGHYSPGLDRGELVESLDLALTWNALRQMFANDLSAARPGSMASLGGWVFTHDHRLSNYPSHKLFDHLSIKRNPEGPSKGGPARHYRDYIVTMQPLGENIKGVEVTELFNDWTD